MLEINDLSINNSNRTLLHLMNMQVVMGEFAVVTGKPNSGKSLLAKTIHGLYQQKSGNVTIFGENTKSNLKSYLITKDVKLLLEKSLNYNISYYNKKFMAEIMDYIVIAELADKLSIAAKSLAYDQQKLLEISIACGLSPALLIVDDFDKIVSKEMLEIVGKILVKFSKDGGSVLMTATTELKEIDNKFIIEDGEVRKL